MCYLGDVTMADAKVAPDEEPKEGNEAEDNDRGSRGSIVMAPSAETMARLDKAVSNPTLDPRTNYVAPL